MTTPAAKSTKIFEVFIYFKCCFCTDQTKSVTITANTEPTNMVLMIKGKVTAKDEKK